MAAQNETSVKPHLIVFDLDYTLWPFRIGIHVNPPFTKDRSGQIFDKQMQVVLPYPEVQEVLSQLHARGLKMAVASRTRSIREALELVKLFGWNQYFCLKEIYPGSKVKHFRRFHEKTGIPYQDMLFFDDEPRTVADVEKMGVTCVLVKEGVSSELVSDGHSRFASRQQS